MSTVKQQQEDQAILTTVTIGNEVYFMVGPLNLINHSCITCSNILVMESPEEARINEENQARLQEGKHIS